MTQYECNNNYAFVLQEGTVYINRVHLKKKISTSKCLVVQCICL